MNVARPATGRLTAIMQGTMCTSPGQEGRGLGTVFYDFHDGITHVVVGENANGAVRYVA